MRQRATRPTCVDTHITLNTRSADTCPQKTTDQCLAGSFLGDTFYERLGLMPDDILGRPLASIVDPRDVYALRCTVCEVLSRAGGVGGAGRSESPSGSLVNLRVVSGGRSYEAGMTITTGSEGFIIVTRLY